MILSVFYLCYSAFFVTVEIESANLVVRAAAGLSYLYLAYEAFKNGYL